jgi:hypothetical protein
MTRYKLSLRTKIVATIIGVTLLVVVGGAWKAAQQVRAAEQTGVLLQRPLKRYVDTMTQVGSGEYAITRMIASDPAVVAALATADSAGLAEAAKRIADVLQSSIVPDLFVISDVSGKVTSLPGVKTQPEADSPRLAARGTGSRAPRSKLQSARSEPFCSVPASIAGSRTRSPRAVERSLARSNAWCWWSATDKSSPARCRTRSGRS